MNLHRPNHSLRSTPRTAAATCLARRRRNKNLLTAVVATAAVLLSASASADDAKKHGEDLHVGLGLGMPVVGLTVVGGSVVTAPFGGASIAVPIDIGGVVRIEPELGFNHRSDSEEQDSGVTTTTNTNQVRLGVGAFYWFTPAESVGAYVGGRLGPSFVFSGTSQEGGGGGAVSGSISQTNFNIGPAFGAEYYLSPQFCIGAEAQLNFTVLGDESRSIDPDPGVPVDTQTESGLIAATSMMLTMRVFLN